MEPEISTFGVVAIKALQPTTARAAASWRGVSVGSRSVAVVRAENSGHAQFPVSGSARRANRTGAETDLGEEVVDVEQDGVSTASAQIDKWMLFAR